MPAPLPPLIEIEHERLIFDPENPRLPESLRGSRDQPAIIGWMLSGESIIELMGSIGETGYFPGEPLLAVATTDGDYIVVEGNRRLTAVKLLARPELAPTKRKAVAEAAAAATIRPQVVPTMVFDERDDILSFLGYRHITGVKSWSSLAKAKYLEQLRRANPNASFSELARNIGSRSDHVARLLVGLAVYSEIQDQDFYGIRGLDEESISFSVLTTALNYSNIAEFVGLRNARDPALAGLDHARLGELTRWIFEKTPENTTRVGESRNLKILNQVVSEKNALASFRRGVSLEESAILTNAPSESFHVLVSSARDQLQTAKGQSHHVQEFTAGDDEVLDEIRLIVRDLRVVVTTRSILQAD